MKPTVLLYPHNSLKKVAEPLSLEEIQSEVFRFRISEMFRIMYYRGGVGLAAPQIGWNARVFIGNPTGKPEHSSQSFVFANPEWYPEDNSKRAEGKEGCLSLPGIYIPVVRYDKVRVKALNYSGEEFEVEAKGFLARIIQHEYDHLEGHMMINKATDESLITVEKQLETHIKRVKAMRRRREAALRKKQAQLRKKEKSRAKSKNRRKRKRKK